MPCSPRCGRRRSARRAPTCRGSGCSRARRASGRGRARPRRRRRSPAGRARRPDAPCGRNARGRGGTAGSRPWARREPRANSDRTARRRRASRNVFSSTARMRAPEPSQSGQLQASIGRSVISARPARTRLTMVTTRRRLISAMSQREPVRQRRADADPERRARRTRTRGRSCPSARRSGATRRPSGRARRRTPTTPRGRSPPPTPSGPNGATRERRDRSAASETTSQISLR